MNAINLRAPGEPMGKQRPRWSKFGTYTPKKTLNYETYIKELFVHKYPKPVPMERALEIKIKAYLMIPASASKKKKALMEENKIKPTKKPDVDNCLKIALDALQGLAFKNDSQIVRADVSKQWSHTPRLEIRIREVE